MGLWQRLMRKFRGVDDNLDTQIKSGGNFLKTKKSKTVFENDLRGLEVIDASASVDDYAIKLQETQDVLKYITPSFRAKATIAVPPGDDSWEIGWIQACKGLTFINRYGDLGYTSWEFREILTGHMTMISDSDGRRYPWYGPHDEHVATVLAPRNERIEVTVEMQDNFSPQVTWRVPTSRTKSEDEGLTHISRDQEFVTWLAARHFETGNFVILKTFSWHAQLAINVNSTKELHSRGEVFGQNFKAKIETKNIPIPETVMHPPNANSAQVLIWREFGDEVNPQIIVQPKETALDQKQWKNLEKGNILPITKNEYLVRVIVNTCKRQKIGDSDSLIEDETRAR